MRKLLPRVTERTHVCGSEFLGLGDVVLASLGEDGGIGSRGDQRSRGTTLVLFSVVNSVVIDALRKC